MLYIDLLPKFFISLVSRCLSNFFIIYGENKPYNILIIEKPFDESKLDTSKILIHSIVKIKNVANKMEFSYKLVADSETNIKEGKLSVNSPIGKGLLGKKVGDIAEIQTPGGIMHFEIISISR